MVFTNDPIWILYSSGMHIRSLCIPRYFIFWTLVGPSTGDPKRKGVPVGLPRARHSLVKRPKNSRSVLSTRLRDLVISWRGSCIWTLLKLLTKCRDLWNHLEHKRTWTSIRIPPCSNFLISNVLRDKHLGGWALNEATRIIIFVNFESY